MTEENKNLNTEINPDETAGSADGAILIKLYEKDNMMKVGVLSYNKHDNNKPLGIPPMLVGLCELQNRVFGNFCGVCSPEIELIEEINKVQDQFSNLSRKMVDIYIKKIKEIRENLTTNLPGE